MDVAAGWLVLGFGLRFGVGLGLGLGLGVGRYDSAYATRTLYTHP